MNIQNFEKFLPLGSVVLLSGGSKRLMINGYYVIGDEDENKVYDYSGVLFPEGILNSEQFFVFNHEQIVKIDYLGLVDNEQKEFMKKLDNTVINRQ